MIFNGVDFTPYFVVEDVRRALLPPRALVSTKVSGAVGDQFLRLIQNQGKIEVDIRFIGTKDQVGIQKRRVAAGLLHTEGPQKLTLPDDPGRYNMAILSESTDLTKLLGTASTTLTFICLDPLTYGQKKTFNISTNPTMFNSGTFSAKGVITINIVKNVNFIKAVLSNNGEYVRVNHNFAIGDKLVIDLGGEDVSKNNQPIMRDVDIESDFFDIPKGEFSIDLSSNAGAATLEFIERWL